MLGGKSAFRIPIGLVVMAAAAFFAVQFHQFSSAAAAGSIQVTSCNYDGSGDCYGHKQGNVEVHVQSVGFATTDVAHNCNPYNLTTNTDHSSPTYGQAHFPNCWSASAGTKVYTLSFINPPSGYSCRSVHWSGGSSDCSSNNIRFEVKAGAESRVEVWLNPPTASAPPPPPPAPASAPAAGSIQATTYIYNNDSSLTRIGNTEVHVQAVGFATTDVAHNCNPYNLTTNSNHSSTGYGQAHFPNCWSASTGTKAYQFSQIITPAGYTFRSIHSSNLRSDGYFDVHAGQETAVDIWLNPPGQSGGATSSSGSGNLATAGGGRQVVGSQQITGQVVTRSLNGSSPATAGGFAGVNAGVPSLLDDIIADTGDPELDSVGTSDDAADSEDTAPPSPPGLLKAVEVAAGTVLLSWQAASDNEGVDSYSIERSVNGSAWEPIGDGITDTDYIDTATAYNQRYSYRVSTLDLSGNQSGASTIEITIKPFKVNAPAGDRLPDSVESQDGHATLTLPDGASRINLECGLILDDQDGQDVLANYGDIVSGPYLPVCKDADGDTVDSFDQSVDMSIDVSDDGLSGDDDMIGFDGDGWSEAGLDSESEDGTPSSIKNASASKIKKGKITTYHLKSKQPVLFAVASKAKLSGGNGPVIIGATLSLMLLVVLGGWWYKRRRNRPPGGASPVGPAGPGPNPDIGAYIHPTGPPPPIPVDD